MGRRFTSNTSGSILDRSASVWDLLDPKWKGKTDPPVAAGQLCFDGAALYVPSSASGTKFLDRLYGGEMDLTYSAIFARGRLVGIGRDQTVLSVRLRRAHGTGTSGGRSESQSLQRGPGIGRTTVRSVS